MSSIVLQHPTRSTRPAPRTWWRLVLALALTTLLVLPRGAGAQLAEMPKQLERVGVVEHLDQQLPLDASFRDHAGNPTTLGTILNGKRPAVFLFAYQSCITVCSMVLKAAGKSIHSLPWTVGKDFDLIVVSIDPEEKLEDTQRSRNLMIADYGRQGSEAGFHFLTGDAATVERTLDAAGVQVQFDAEQRQWGHPAVLLLTKPSGGIARYLYGLEFSPNDVRIGLLEASEGRSISTVEQLILYCYHYDPQGGRYALVAMNVMRLVGGTCAIVLAGFLAVMWRRERKKAALEAQTAATSPTPNAAAGASRSPNSSSAAALGSTSSLP